MTEQLPEAEGPFSERSVYAAVREALRDAEVAPDLKEVKAKLDSLESSVNTINTTLAVSNEKIQGLQHEISKAAPLAANIASLEQKISNLIDNTQGVHDLNSKISAVDGELKGLAKANWIGLTAVSVPLLIGLMTALGVQESQKALGLKVQSIQEDLTKVNYLLAPPTTKSPIITTPTTP